MRVRVTEEKAEAQGPKHLQHPTHGGPGAGLLPRPTRSPLLVLITADPTPQYGGEQGTGRALRSLCSQRFLPGRTVHSSGGPSADGGPGGPRAPPRLGNPSRAQPGPARGRDIPRPHTLAGRAPTRPEGQAETEACSPSWGSSSPPRAGLQLSCPSLSSCRWCPLPPWAWPPPTAPPGLQPSSSG